ncbi:MAG: HD domain-containing protein [Bacilli bacterium]|jgi:hypothetical protein|nr:HD domain-containing protein [Bacilli bacterium]
MGQTNIGKDSIFTLLGSFLDALSPDFSAHQKRVAFYLYRIGKELNLESRLRSALVFSGLFHDVGANKLTDLEQLFPFDPEGTYPHSLRTYLLLKYYSPLGDFSKALLYHHARASYQCEEPYYKDGLLIHLADRFDVALMASKSQDIALKMVNSHQGDIFLPEHVAALNKAVNNTDLVAKIFDGTFAAELKNYLISLPLGDDFIVEIKQMIVSLSEYFTSLNPGEGELAGWIGARISELMDLNKKEQDYIQNACLLKNIGHVRLNLIKAKSLSKEAVEVQSLEASAAIVREAMPMEISNLILNSLELMDGSGIPNGRTSGELSTLQKVVIFSCYLAKSLSSQENLSDNNLIRVDGDVALETAKGLLPNQPYNIFNDNKASMADAARLILLKARDKRKKIDAEEEALKDANKWSK